MLTRWSQCSPVGSQWFVDVLDSIGLIRDSFKTDDMYLVLIQAHSDQIVPIIGLIDWASFSLLVLIITYRNVSRNCLSGFVDLSANV